MLRINPIFTPVEVRHQKPHSQKGGLRFHATKTDNCKLHYHVGLAKGLNALLMINIVSEGCYITKMFSHIYDNTPIRIFVSTEK